MPNSADPISPIRRQDVPNGLHRTITDFIHRHWASWLELDMAAPDEGATPAQWKAYREAVERGISKYEAEQRARELAKPSTKP